MSLVLYTYICCHIFKILESATKLNTTPSGIKWYTWRYLSRLLQANSKLKTERQRTKIWTSLSFSVKTTTWGVWFLLLISALEIHKKRKAGNALPTVFHVGKGWWGQKSQKWLWVPGGLLTSSCPGGRCFKAILEQSFSAKKTNNMQAKGTIFNKVSWYCSTTSSKTEGSASFSFAQTKQQSAKTSAGLRLILLPAMWHLASHAQMQP